MNTITSPLKIKDQKEEVANLNSGLLFLIDKAVISTAGLNLPLSADQVKELINKKIDQYDELTVALVQAFQKKQQLQENGEVDQPTADKLNSVLKDSGAFDQQIQYKVSGQVFNSLGEAIAQQEVVAFDVDLPGARIYKTVNDIQKITENGGFQILNKTITNADGYYEIPFNSLQFNNAEMGLADVIVFAVLKDKIIGRSLLSAEKNYQNGVEIKNWNVYLETSDIRGISEYSRIMEPVSDLIKLSKLDLYQLSDSNDQIEFLANETEQDFKRITLLVQADKLKSDVSKDVLSHELLYSIGAQNIPLQWTYLVLKSQDDLKKAILTSIQKNIISAFSEQDIQSFIKLLQDYAHQFLLTENDNEKNHDISKIIGFSISDTFLQTTFLTAHADFTDTPEKFWKEYLPLQPGFKDNPSLISSLQLSNQLSILTGNHISLIEELQVNRKLTSAKELLQLGSVEWNEILNKTGWPSFIKEESKQDYINGIQNLLHAAFATNKIALMVKNKEINYEDDTIAATLNSFLEQATTFDFSSSLVRDYKDVIASIAKDKENILTQHLQKLQRVYQVSPTPKAMATLINLNLNSAYQIANIPLESFIKNYGEELGSEEAFNIHKRAINQVSRTQLAATTLYELTNSVQPASTPYSAQRDQIIETVKRHIPNYEELFGNEDICECKECQSVYSAAAYLVDILRFLGMSTKNEVLSTPLNVLLSRRPDLEYLLLTCENTNTLIPYIDLANEVMEYYVQWGRLNAGAANNTANITVEELRANPQFTLTEAYKKLSTAVYPFSLPYHQPLDVIRKFLGHLQTSRYEIMDRFKNSSTNQNALAAEYLTLSKEEFTTITNKTFDETSSSILIKPLELYYGYSNNDDTADHATFIATIYKIPVLLGRTGILYIDLIEMINTKFINPYQNILDFTEEHFSGSIIAPNDLYNKMKQIKAGSLTVTGDAALMQALNAQPENFRLTPEEFTAWVNNNFDNLGKVVTLYEPNSKCDLTTTSLRTIKDIYENPEDHDENIMTDTLSRLNRFIRLWKRIGWSINELDQLIISLGETDITTELIRKLAEVKQIAVILKLPLLQLGSIWGNIDTYGDKSLYAQFFSSKSINRDIVFDADKFGNYFSSSAETRPKVNEHIPAILSAFKITASDLNFILKDANIDNSANLTIENLSSIYRYVLLAKSLKLTPYFLILLKQLLISNNVFATPSETLKFIQLAKDINATGFKIPALNYILNGEANTYSQAYALKEDKVFNSLRVIRDAFKQIEQDNPTPDLVVDEELLRKKLSLLYSQDITEQLIAILNCPLTFTSQISTEKNIQVTIPAELQQKITYDTDSGFLTCTAFLTDSEKNTLENLTGASNNFKTAIQYIFNQEIAIINSSKIVYSVVTENPSVVFPTALMAKITYDQTTHRLQCKGILSDEEKNILNNLDGASDNFKSAIDSLYQKPGQFLADNFSSFLGGDSAFIQKLLDHPASADKKTVNEKYNYFYKTYLPYLKNKLRQNIVIQNIAALIGLSEDLTYALIANDIDNLIAWLSKEGLSGRYYKDVSFSEAEFGFDRIDKTIDFTHDLNTGDVPFPEANISVRWQGWISPSINGNYNFFAEKDSTADTARLLIDAQEISSTSIPLSAGKFYNITLEYIRTTGNAGIHLSWKNENTLKEVISSSYLITYEVAQHFEAVLQQLDKASLLIQGFKLNQEELEHFIKFKDNFSGINFLKLTLEHWQRINQYALLQNAIPQTSATLIQVFNLVNKNPQPTLDNVIDLIVQLTGWEKNYFQHQPGLSSDFITKFNLGVESFQNEIALLHLNRIIQLTNTTGIFPKILDEWSDTTSDFDTLNIIAQEIKKTVKAKYEEADWLDVAKSINNKIRENQKQALISYLLVKKELIDWGVQDTDSLFEYFLIDVQMDACMDTTRIVQAISSVQLFVNRCLLNLESIENSEHKEAGVSPGQIDTGHWTWMKNYRLWEANRKIFLYPENWLEPEWRDDKSPFFKELEFELLQNDITAGSIETAFRNYLYKLADVANLQVCGMYDDNETDTLHVFARTQSRMPYQYFYRIRDSFKHWSAWEKVTLDIRGVEDNANNGRDSGVHLIPVVWKKRLFLFWPEFMEKHEDSNLTGNAQDNSRRELSTLQPKRYWEVKLVWSEYKDKKWTPKQVSSEFFRPNYISIENPQTGEKIQADLIAQLKDYRFTIYIDDNSQIHFQLRFGQYSHGEFDLSDINSNIVIRDGGYIPIEQMVDYSNQFMSFERFAGSLRLNQTDYLQSPKDHTLICSDNVIHPNTVNYPFFYRDAQRIYFAEPVDAVSIVASIKNPDLSKFVALDLAKNAILEDGQKYQDDVATIGVRKSQKPDSFFNTSSFQSSSVSSAKAVFNKVVSQPNITGSSYGNIDLPSTVKNETAQMQSAGTIGGAFEGTNNYVPTIYFNLQVEFIKDKSLKFYNFFHPFIIGPAIEDINDQPVADQMYPGFITDLNNGGIDKLLQADTSYPDDNNILFKNTYNPDTGYAKVNPSLPKLNVDFDQYGAYSGYNWELFFHIPLFLATRLSRNGKYAEAMQWFHYIFNPTTNEPVDPGNPNARYWQVLPFKPAPTDSIEEILSKLQPNNNPSKVDPAIAEWLNNPFKPHVVARNRPVEYMKNVIFKYVENFIAWGDDLFRNDTMESVNEATQLYIIAAHILGPRPQFIPKRGKVKPETFNSIKDKLDDFSNVQVQLENIFPFTSSIPLTTTSYSGSLLGMGNSFYFCIPNNENMLQYWDKVADRLFKIRHCMNIEGVERTLALFAPTIDPGMLAAAAAQGLNIGSILSDLNTPAPLYRFNYLVQKATEFCSEVKALGSALLAAIEKKEAEELGRMRAMHETTLLVMITQVKERQVLEARANREALIESRNTVIKRMTYYRELLADTDLAVSDPPELPMDVNSDSDLPSPTNISDIQPNVDVSLVDGGERGVKLIPKEKQELDKGREAQQMQFDIAQLEIFTNYLHLIPELAADVKPFGVGTGLSFGGKALGFASSSIAKSLQTEASNLSFQATQAAKMSSYIRREQEWTQQANMAAREIIQIDKQITASDIRVQIAQKELENHQKQIENSREVEQFLRDKFSNQELYQWMREQIFSVYKQSYQLAYDMAKKAEKAYRFETGINETNFIQYGYWNDMYQGIGSGEKLHLAIKQMEKAYIEGNRRELELAKHISLSMLNANALLQLKQTGSCQVDLPEELFDLDYPGHYFRRIKSVSLTIPCVVGPYTTVNCSLRLLKNSVRINTLPGTQYEHNNQEGVFTDDVRFIENNIPFKSIATSSAQNDSGVFELSFRDERYLPFEGAGVISTWQLELNGKYVVNGNVVNLSQFDYNSIADIIFHVKYTAREDAGLFRTNAIEYLQNYLKIVIDNMPSPFMRLLSLKTEFPNAFYKLMNDTPQATDVEIANNHFPYLFSGKHVIIERTTVFLKPKVNQSIIVLPTLTVASMNGTTVSTPSATVEASNWQKFFNTEMLVANLSIGDNINPLRRWNINAGTNGLNKEEIDDVLILLTFKASAT